MAACSQCGRLAVFDYPNLGLRLCIDCSYKIEQMDEQRFRRLRAEKAGALRQMAHVTGDEITWLRADAIDSSQRPAGQRSVIMNNINIAGSQIGLINTGTITKVQALDITLSRVKESGSPELSGEVAKIAEAVVKSGLDPALKDEAVRQLDVLANEAALLPPDRKPTLARVAISALQVVLSTSADLTQLWQAFLPTVLSASRHSKSLHATKRPGDWAQNRQFQPSMRLCQMLICLVRPARLERATCGLGSLPARTAILPHLRELAPMLEVAAGHDGRPDRSEQVRAERIRTERAQ